MENGVCHQRSTSWAISSWQRASARGRYSGYSLDHFGLRGGTQAPPSIRALKKIALSRPDKMPDSVTPSLAFFFYVFFRQIYVMNTCCPHRRSGTHFGLQGPLSRFARCLACTSNYCDHEISPMRVLLFRGQHSRCRASDICFCCPRCPRLFHAPRRSREPTHVSNIGKFRLESPWWSDQPAISQACPPQSVVKSHL
jgi:hypothetical protein